VTACKLCKHATSDRQCLASPIVAFDYWKAEGFKPTGQFYFCWQINTAGSCDKFEPREMSATSNGS
jgi:hypothetical protein